MGEDIPKRGGERIQTFWVIVGAPLSVVPLLYFIAYFCQFFFFMDEWELIHKMNSLGYEKWLVEFYGGNFVPVFKLYWSALLFIGGGNYHILIWSGFILHGVVILERALSKIPFRRIRIVITVAILFWISSWVFNPWSTFLPAWSESRGTSVRNLITSDNLDPGNFDISSFDKVSNERAQELAELYQLH